MTPDTTAAPPESLPANLSGDVPDGWQGILTPGERILWQGRPDARLALSRNGGGFMAFGLLFSGFAFVWMAIAALAGGWGWLIGIGHFALGMLIALGMPLLDRRRRRRTWYTLTDRRVLIATDIPPEGRKLESWPIAPDAPISLTGGRLPDILLATRAPGAPNGRWGRPLRLERLHDAPTVAALMHAARTARGPDPKKAQDP